MIGAHLPKDTLVRCGDWEADELTAAQVISAIITYDLGDWEADELTAAQVSCRVRRPATSMARVCR